MVKGYDFLTMRRTDFVFCNDPTMVKYAERLFPGAKIAFGYYPALLNEPRMFHIGPDRNELGMGPRPYYAAPSYRKLLNCLRTAMLDRLVLGALAAELDSQPKGT
jgi:hypothetical protein